MPSITGAQVEAEQNDRSDIELPGYQLLLLKDVVFTMQGTRFYKLPLSFEAMTAFHVKYLS